MEYYNRLRYWLLAVGLWLLAVGAWAQQKNVLSVPDAKVSIGTSQLPVAIENNDEIVGVQFDLTLPSTISAGNEAILTNRCDGHRIIIRNMSATRYRVMLISDDNRPLIAQQGTVFYIPLTIPQTVTEGSELPLVISNATLSIVSGENVLTEAKAGKLIVSSLPDLTVKGIAVTGDLQSPATITPGKSLSLSWQVQNVGGAATAAGWSEQLLLVNKHRTLTKLMATTYYQQTLAAGATITRQADITVPQLLGIEGEAYVQVKIIATSETGESSLATGNNTAQTDETITVGKRLFVEPNPARIAENYYTQRVLVKVSRSGDWSGEQTFLLSATDDSRISLPASVKVPAGQSGASVYMTIADNSVLDNDSIVIITATGNGYGDATNQLVIEDNEYPDLALTASKNILEEGETFQLTVSTSRVSSTPIIVSITSEDVKRFSFPSTVTIPAGMTSVTFDVTAIDDELPSLDLSNAFKASAPKHNKAEAIVLLKDNDLPVLELQLTPTTVTENVGVVAVAGVLRRTTNTNSKITVKLSDDADGGLYFGNRTLVLDKGVEEVHFNFGPVDNTNVDGDRTYTITAAVWLSSCSCGASGESAGYVDAQLQVLDNDGPALSLTSSLGTVKEGGKTTLTVTRNTTDNATPLTVTISSDYEDGLTYEHTVTIPAGQQSATVEVISAKNSVQGDSHTVVFTVQAEGYATGSCYVMVTDQTLPDASIGSIAAVSVLDGSAVESQEVGTKMTLTIEVVNDGAAPLPIEIPVKIYRRGESNAVATIFTTEAIGIGGNLTLTKVIYLPTTVGSNSYYAVVNEDQKVKELSFTNNTSQDIVVNTVAPFNVAVSTDKSVYNQNEKVVISGQLTGNGTANSEVDIYVVNEGVRQVQTVTTDAQGAFSYEWQLYNRQSGHFVLGACYPGEGLTTEMASFDVYGLRRTENSIITCDVIYGDTANGTITLANPGNLGLTGAKVEMVSVPESCEPLMTIPETIGAGQTVQLTYALKAVSLTSENKWEEVKARVTTNEGATLDLTLYFYGRNAVGKLVASTQRIVTTMAKDKAREYTIQVTNIGRGNTGKITLALPAFIKSLAGNSLPSIAQNDTLTIPLSFNPTADMQLNVPVTGQIGINCENGDGTPVSFSITPVSDQTGTLVIDVCDEYTYYTNEAPHVEGAEVVVRNPVTGALVTQGLTDSNGLFTAVLPEGYYKISATANKHDSYTNNIYVDPGTETRQTVNLSISTVTVDWNVVETEVEDEYKIVTTVTYETNVPAPVVIMEAPEKIDLDAMAVGESVMFYVAVTNKGLISANDVTVILPEPTSEWEMTHLSDAAPFTLAPQTTVFVPVKLTKTAQPGFSRVKKDAGQTFAACMANLRDRYKYMCGTDWKDNEGAINIALKICLLGALLDELSSFLPSWGGGIGTPNGGGRGSYGGTSGSYHVSTGNGGICDPATAGMANAAIDAGVGVALGGYGAAGSAMSAAYGGASAASSLAGNGSAASKAGSAASAVAGCCGPWGSLAGALGGMASSQLSRQTQLLPSAPRKTRESTGISWLDSYYERITPFCEELKLLDEAQMELFGDSIWMYQEKEDIEKVGNFLMSLADDVTWIDPAIALDYKPAGMSEEQYLNFIQRVNNTSSDLETENRIDFDNYITICNRIVDYEVQAMAEGYSSNYELFVAAYNQLQLDYDEASSSSSVCAKIKLEISQTMTMTRQAFRGTLTVTNGSENGAMENVRLTLNVTNRTTGEVATSHEFQINAETLNGFEGALELGSDWTLAANSTGTATILFIPTKYAAPEGPVEWAFGGTLSYLDPFSGLEVTRELYPVTLTVKPSPELDLTYFMQRDVYGDDPLTLDVVEPMKPAEFALLINNKGNGDATNVRMVTQQPKIIENEKGLYIDFELISSQVNGGEAALSFGKEITNDFGTIPAHSQMYAQWWLTSTLLGHFIDYNIEATHVTSYGNEDLSLLDQVTIHELIHGFNMPATVQGDVQDPSVRAFLVNDIADANDMPDRLYFTNGDTASVALAAMAQIERTSPTTCLLTITPTAAGWNYGSLLDPTHGYAELKSIVRQSDGKELCSVQGDSQSPFWKTDRTLRDGKDWLYEQRLHFVDQFMSTTSETYVLTFDPVPEVMLAVKSIGPLANDDKVIEAPVESLTVEFTKEIETATFSGEDLTFAVQGVKQDAAQIGISTTDNKSFTLDMSTINETLPNGYYTLTVQTADITDAEGFKGRDGKQVSWILFRGGLVVINTSVWPADAGNVTVSYSQPASARSAAPGVVDSKAQYGSTIVFKAKPEVGREFQNWTLNGEVVSTDPEYTVVALSDMDVVANFSIVPIHIEVCESEGGHIEGISTGIYDYHTDLQLTAVPDEDYVLKGWLVNDKAVDNPSLGANCNPLLRLNADSAMTIKAVFEREYYRQTMTLARGWNWVSSYISEAWPLQQIAYNANRIVGQVDELINDPQYGMVGGLDQLTAGAAYKVEARQSFTNTFRGHLLNTSIILKKGWNWIAYPSTATAAIDAVVTNAEEGEFIVSQQGFTEYAGGYWAGSLNTLTPGVGYLYKSASNKTITFGVVANASRHHNVVGNASQRNNVVGYASERNNEVGNASERYESSAVVDTHRYPNTMNITACLYRNQENLTGNDYIVYAVAGDELRGVSQFVGSNYYLTVYGDQPVEITFIVENVETGEQIPANETLTFCDDVVGSRSNPFTFNIGGTTGIVELENGKCGMDNVVYDLQGRRMESSILNLHSSMLKKGVYIVNGHKRVVGRTSGNSNCLNK